MSELSAIDSGLEGAVHLAGQGRLRAHGAEAASFLHAQLTTDIAGLSMQQARLAALCTAKGRMVASFLAFKRSEDEIWLAGPTDVLRTALKRLRMFVLRAKVHLEEADDDAVMLGLAGAAAKHWLVATAPSAAELPVWGHARLPDGTSIVRLPDGAGCARWLGAMTPAMAKHAIAALPALPTTAWDWLEVQSGIAPVQATTVEAFVPQMLNYDLVGGVDFRKGCYPGQEVVARSQYRGTLKRRAVALHGTAPMTAGQEVYSSIDPAQPCGLVALAAPAPSGGHDALVELKLQALEHGSLHLGAADGPVLLQRPLPYALPTAADAAA